MKPKKKPISKKYAFQVKLRNKKTGAVKYVPLNEYNKKLPKHDQDVAVDGK